MKEGMRKPLFGLRPIPLKDIEDTAEILESHRQNVGSIFEDELRETGDHRFRVKMAIVGRHKKKPISVSLQELLTNAATGQFDEKIDALWKLARDQAEQRRAA